MWRPQAYFALAAALIGVILWSAKPFVPDVLQTEFAKGWLVQIQTVCLVGAAYFSLRASLKNKRHHILNFVILLAYFVTIGFLIRKQVMASRDVSRFIYQGYVSDNSSMHFLSERALSEETEEERRKMAHAAFRIYGLTVAYKDGAGNLAFYTPNDDDRHESTELRELRAESENGVKTLEAMLCRQPDNVGTVAWIFGGIFLFFFGCDILLMIFRRS